MKKEKKKKREVHVDLLDEQEENLSLSKMKGLKGERHATNKGGLTVL